MTFPKIDTKGDFYKNCVRNRRHGAKICQVCPFRAGIEAQEKQGRKQRLAVMIRELKRLARLRKKTRAGFDDTAEIHTKGAADLDECLGRMGVDRRK